MKTEMNVLIVEDHHMIVDSYRSMFSLITDIAFNIFVANTCDEADQLLQVNSNIEFKLVFLDWGLPHSENKKLYNGGDLIKLINLHSPRCKIVVFTSHTEAFILYDINKKFSPAAILCKTDFFPQDFPNVLNQVITGGKYFSQTVLSQIKQITSRLNYLDNYNRQIIILLSKGVKTKNLPKYLPLSIAAIDKRKVQIKDYLLLGKGDDEDIVRAAKKLGLISKNTENM